MKIEKTMTVYACSGVTCGTAVETRELSEDVYLDLDEDGHVVSITVEHASRRGDLSEISFQRIGREANKALEATS